MDLRDLKGICGIVFSDLCGLFVGRFAGDSRGFFCGDFCGEIGRDSGEIRGKLGGEGGGRLGGGWERRVFFVGRFFCECFCDFSGGGGGFRDFSRAWCAERGLTGCLGLARMFPLVLTGNIPRSGDVLVDVFGATVRESILSGVVLNPSTPQPESKHLCDIRDVARVWRFLQLFCLHEPSGSVQGMCVCRCAGYAAILCQLAAMSPVTGRAWEESVARSTFCDFFGMGWDVPPYTNTP